MVITVCCDWLAPRTDVHRGAGILSFVPASYINLLDGVAQPLGFQYLSSVIYKVRAVVLD